MESQIFLRIEFQTPESFSPRQGGETKAGGCWLWTVGWLNQCLAGASYDAELLSHLVKIVKLL